MSEIVLLLPNTDRLQQVEDYVRGWYLVEVEIEEVHFHSVNESILNQIINKISKGITWIIRSDSEASQPTERGILVSDCSNSEASHPSFSRLTSFTV
jgi:hypothetical protein